ncbi:MAG: deoxyguanosinetriphosphate triphosphohydrolase [Dehalococcoidia bacterium DG_18]|nr:MAG: deoxyguanosinetriphosphate triphosphohydrolase [Dehalococcoidia bacterium DG_18]
MVHHDIRQHLEEREESLSPHAMRSRLSHGRERYEEPCPVRTAFQRDRDRIIHSKAFRRLMHKTQVFIAPTSDHYRTRLTHTLEVSQIARTIARALNLNEGLTEAISLGHDLGHPPFGHAGEEILDELYPQGFTHARQSLRVVQDLENDGQGLNLTYEVRDGILKHSKPRADIFSEEGGIAATLEGQICKLADAVAYINHDIDDAIRSEIIAEDGIPMEIRRILGCSHRERINTLVCDIINHSWTASGAGEGTQRPVIGMSPEIKEAVNSLRNFLFNIVYHDPSLIERKEKGKRILRILYKYYCENPYKLEPKYLPLKGEVERTALDYIAGMTDRFALQHFEDLYLP